MSWDTFGSPYDPNYRGKGKITRPQVTDRAEQEQHQLGSCGDPACPFCNPVTSRRFSSVEQSKGPIETSWSNAREGASSASLNDALRKAMNEMSDRLTNRSLFGEGLIFFDSNPSSTAAKDTKPSPPGSYTEARKAVSQWIIAAPELAFDDIVGNDAALAQLRDAIQAPVTHKALYDAYGLKMPKGALLSGPPGCGKTMFARAAASEMKRLYGAATEFISISGAELQSRYVGETEERIKAIFTFAREYEAFHGHPLLVFMDEAEVLLPDRTGRVRRVAPWEESQVATFLAEMDGMQESGAFVLLATNRPTVIDQAVLRDGRCDFKIVVQRPTPEAIESILRKNFAGVLIGSDSKLEELVFAAVECLHDPQKIIIDAQTIKIDFNAETIERGHKHFLLEHIVSGAMAASIPGRAKRSAFTRDKADGIARGVTTSDVVKAVNDIFEENRGLDHAFAFDAFRREFLTEAAASQGPDRG